MGPGLALVVPLVMETGEPEAREARIAGIAAMVERYLAAHPTASDTVAGIHRWWLPPTSADEDAGLLDQALERLIGRGLMTKRALPDGHVIFSGRVR